MKLPLLLLCCFGSLAVSAQNISVNPNYGPQPSEANFQPVQIGKGVCITDEARQEALEAIAANKAEILRNNPNAFQKRGGHPLFILPIRAKAGFDDYGYYTLNNQVDHNLTPNNNLEDYNCAQRTYDWASGNHGGTDYILWPYPWTKMEDEIMEIIAAAEGTIIDKRDGNFDLNCVNNGNPNWNGIIIEHADGSQAWYWHFKDGAITTKGIGDTVAAGEYLGAAGSSGSSDWPHLHFEVFDTNGDRIDPYAGPCNDMNPDSWWVSQPDYFIPTINRISTHSGYDYFEDCPNEEITYEKLNFEEGELMVFRVFYRDLQEGSNTDFTIYDPNGNVFISFTWTANFGQDYATSWAHFGYTVDNTWPDGVYTLEAVFGGNTYETIFGVNTNLGVEDMAQTEIALYPNPTSDRVFIETNAPIEKVEVFDIFGRNVLEVSPLAEKTELNLSNLKTGIYVAIISSEGKKSIKKIVKE